MSQTIIELKLLRPEIFSAIPEYGTKGSAAIDLHAAIERDIDNAASIQKTVKVFT